MNSMLESIKSTDIPVDIIKEASKQISHYAVGIVKIHKRLSSEDAILAGSGTLVEIDGTLGILTAHHVIKELPSHGEIGLILSEQIHRYTLQPGSVKKIKIASGPKASEGPDLAFLIFQPTDLRQIKALGQIKAKKSFYNLLLRRDRIINNPPENDMGIWILCGFPDERTIREASDRGFDTIMAFHGLCDAGWVEKEYISESYDYLEFDVRYDKNGLQRPRSFKGVSGGGLWQVLLMRSSDGIIKPQEIILSGVAFYQSPVINNILSIKCHGRQSIYRILYDVIKDKCS
ncbi:MAG: hypothetical protein ABIF87_15740 [Pseudomonadota bacterium]